MRTTLWRVLAMLLAFVLVASACSSDDDGGSDEAPTDGTEAPTDGTEAPTDGTEAADGSDEVDLTQGDSTLDAVKQAGLVRCGTRDALRGFAFVDPDTGERSGFDNDFCSVIAAAVLGDATATEFVDVETTDRFTQLQSGEYDVLVRNTTFTASRDGLEGATFLQPNYYDGQAMMVAADSEFETIADMDGAVICSAGGTTSEGNVANEASRLGVTLDVLSFDDTALLQEAFLAGRCDGWTSDTSQLVGLRSDYPDGADSLRILDGVFSKEPLAPAVRDGDSTWASAIEWAIFATIQAEEWGITSANVDDFLTSEDPNIKTFLGVEVDGAVLDPGLDLPADMNYQVIKQVGNYGEIFDRHLTPLGLERGLNALYTDGGLQYAPPYK
ncbi:MAG: amino acid ABC transporter substrate-binding protein [Acidimicrobiia bacterium]|nr:amino acid ABC transporter substrate-binding protein [Acidimicrobiia bacterium]MDH5236427.1 amino acid ABC transporter substrate-binding protein [Acidimicrobiia bacterium]